MPRSLRRLVVRVASLARPTPVLLLAFAAFAAFASPGALGAQDPAAPAPVTPPVTPPTTPPVVAPAAAQPTQSASPIDDLIARVRTDIDNLEYAEAIRRGNLVFGFARSMRLEQLIALRSAMSAAFYPEEREAQQSDSALKHLVEMVRLKPDVTLSVETRWAGLDSLLELARLRTFAVQMRPSEQDQLVGTDGRGFVDVISSRPARYKLRIRAMPSGTAVLHDTSAIADPRGRLSFRAHDGRAPLLATGQYEVAVTAIDATTGDTVTVTHLAEATGVAPTLVPPPVFDTAQLKTDMARPPRVKMVMASLFFAGATIAIATVARAPDPIGSEFATDGRATFVGVAMIGAAVAGFWLDKGTVSVVNLQANMAARASYRKAVADAEAANKQKIAEYRVTMKIRPEAR